MATWEKVTWILLGISLAYFGLYVPTGVCPKLFLEGLGGVHKIGQMEFLLHGTIFAGSGLCVVATLCMGWGRPEVLSAVDGLGYFKVGPFQLRKAYLYLFPASVCTAVIVVGTTLMYTFGINVLAAITIMRGCVILGGVLADVILELQGKRKDPVLWEEGVAALTALSAVAASLIYPYATGKGSGAFAFVDHPFALGTLSGYTLAYAVRQYIMGSYKSQVGGTGGRNKNAPKAYFAIEQASAANIIIYGTLAFLGIGYLTGAQFPQFTDLWAAIQINNGGAMLGGIWFGLAAIPSVFLFLFAGRSNTFTAVTNRSVSLLAGLVASLIVWKLGGKPPKPEDFVMFAIVLVAIGFLVKAEAHRNRLKKAAG